MTYDSRADEDDVELLIQSDTSLFSRHNLVIRVYTNTSVRNSVCVCEWRWAYSCFECIVSFHLSQLSGISRATSILGHNGTSLLIAVVRLALNTCLQMMNRLWKRFVIFTTVGWRVRLFCRASRSSHWCWCEVGLENRCRRWRKRQCCGLDWVSLTSLAANTNALSLFKFYVISSTLSTKLFDFWNQRAREIYQTNNLAFWNFTCSPVQFTLWVSNCYSMCSI